MSIVAVNEIGNVTTQREAAAERIKRLMHDWAANTMSLGAELSAAAETFPLNPHPKRKQGLMPERLGFIKWAQQTTGLSDRQIEQLLLIHQRFGGVRTAVRTHLPQRVMKMLVRSDVPESARIEAINRAEKGEFIGTKDAKKIVQVHQLPTAKEANAQAKAEGRPVFARDGYIYFGTDPGKAKEGMERRRMVFGVRDALNHLGNIHLTARQFLDYAFPHQLWTPQEAIIIKKALRWLIDLDSAWDARK